jgi:hypothetical protein
MIKSNYTNEGKVYSGDIEAVPGVLRIALEGFVSDNNWTGGKLLHYYIILLFILYYLIIIILINILLIIKTI